MPLEQVDGWQDKSVHMLSIASTLMWTCSIMCIIDMPLWISLELDSSDKLVGILMGTAVGLEIPAMILVSYYVKCFGKRRIVIAAIAAGMLFYLGLISFHGCTTLLVLQLFNVVFIGIIAGVGMLWFQDLVFGHAGSATTLFTNSVSTGVILAGMIQGVVVQGYDHYAIYWVIAVVSVVMLQMTGQMKGVQSGTVPALRCPTRRHPVFAFVVFVGRAGRLHRRPVTCPYGLIALRLSDQPLFFSPCT